MTTSNHDDRERSVDAPRFAGWLLRRVLSEEATEALIGDLVEEAATSTDRRVSSWPRLWIVWQAFLHLNALRTTHRHEHRQEQPLRSSRPRRFDEFVQDMRYGLRLCVRAPMFAVIVVITLALGIGLNTAVFSVVNAVLVRPLAYPHAERSRRQFPHGLPRTSPAAGAGQWRVNGPVILRPY